MNPREIIVRRVSKEFKDGMVVNLGFEYQTWYNYIPKA